MITESKSLRLFEALENVDDELIELCNNITAPKKNTYTKYIAMAACLCIVVTVFIISSQRKSIDNISVPSENTSSTQMITTADGNESDITYYTSSENTVTTSVSENIINTYTSNFTYPVTETTEATAEINIAIPEFAPMPEPFKQISDGGGDQNAMFYQPCNRILDNIPVELLWLRDDTEVSNWACSFPSIAIPISSINEYANIYSFITSFDITKDEAETALEYYLNSDDEQTRITREEFDIIFSGDIELITKTFASEYSIVVGENIYCLNWIYSHSIADYLDNGITAEDIERVRLYYDNLMLTDEAKNALNEKLDFFVNMKR